MAIVMVILGMLLGGLLSPLSTQREISQRQEAEEQLQEIHDALIGFAIAQSPSRLPCPASPGPGGGGTNGEEDPVGGGTCNTQHGLIPARTLGLNGNFNNDGELLDPWHRTINYSVSSVSGSAWTTSITLSTPTPNFEVCQDTLCAVTLADNLVAIVYSSAKDITGSALQNENSDNDTRFVLAPYSEGAGNEFDDILHWISPNPLSLQLVKAGRLD